MNAKRQVKCGYCGHKGPLWTPAGDGYHRNFTRLPNGMERCPNCSADSARAMIRADNQRNAKRRERAERRQARTLAAAA